MPKNAYKKPALQRNKSKDRTAKFLASAKKKAKDKVGYKGHQGYAAREDESLGMRRGKESTKKQGMKARRDESYGAWGKRKGGKVNKPKGTKPRGRTRARKIG